MAKSAGGYDSGVSQPYNQAMTWQRRLLVLEDEPLVASLIASFLEKRGFAVSSCHDAIGAKRLVSELDPDAVLIDINLGAGPNGLQFGEWLHKSHPDIVQIYLTGTSDPRIWGLPRSPKGHWLSGCTFLAKDSIADSEALVTAIEEAFAERSVTTVLQTLDKSPLSRLTKAELEVLRLAASGLSNSAIAAERGSAVRTVEQQLRAVYTALGIADVPNRNARVDAVRIFIQASGLKAAWQSGG